MADLFSIGVGLIFLGDVMLRCYFFIFNDNVLYQCILVIGVDIMMKESGGSVELTLFVICLRFGLILLMHDVIFGDQCPPFGYIFFVHIPIDPSPNV